MLIDKLGNLVDCRTRCSCAGIANTQWNERVIPHKTMPCQQSVVDIHDFEWLPVSRGIVMGVGHHFAR